LHITHPITLILTILIFFTLPWVSAVAWKKNVKVSIFTHMTMNLLGTLLLAAMILGQK